MGAVAHAAKCARRHRLDGGHRHHLVWLLAVRVGGGRAAGGESGESRPAQDGALRRAAAYISLLAGGPSADDRYGRFPRLAQTSGLPDTGVAAVRDRSDAARDGGNRDVDGAVRDRRGHRTEPAVTLLVRDGGGSLRASESFSRDRRARPDAAIDGAKENPRGGGFPACDVRGPAAIADSARVRQHAPARRFYAGFVDRMAVGRDRKPGAEHGRSELFGDPAGLDRGSGLFRTMAIYPNAVFRQGGSGRERQPAVGRRRAGGAVFPVALDDPV